MPIIKLAKILLSVLLIFCVTFGLHYALLHWTTTKLPYSLFNVYVFHAVFSLIICVIILLIANLSTKYNDQLGFIYLFTMVFKITFFCMVFRDVLFSEIVLNKMDSLSLLTPIFVFLTVEVVIISKVLNKIQIE